MCGTPCRRVERNARAVGFLAVVLIFCGPHVKSFDPNWRIRFSPNTTIGLGPFAKLAISSVYGTALRQDSQPE